MKCTACGEENANNARFCSFCGARLANETDDAPTETQARQTAHPLEDNPYQPHRSPIIPPAHLAHPSPEDEPLQQVKWEGSGMRPVIPSARLAHSAPEEEAQPARPVPERDDRVPFEDGSPRQIIPPAPQRVFLFEEEEEEESRKRAAQRKAQEDALRKAAEDEEDDDDYDDEEEEPRGGRIFLRLFSILTVIVLMIGVFSFLYGTSIGRRLRASYGFSSSAEDYLLLADWQLAQSNMTDAAASYYTAFRLNPDDYGMALDVGTGFERSGDLERAEQLYTYLIENYPQLDEPYDRLMALLNRQGRQEQYQALLTYRSQHQSGYTPPTSTGLVPPTPSIPGGAYPTSVQVALDAGGAAVFYTLDGTQPTTGSLRYTGPITLTPGTHTIRAISVREGEISEEWSGSYIIS